MSRVVPPTRKIEEWPRLCRDESESEKVKRGAGESEPERDEGSNAIGFGLVDMGGEGVLELVL